MEVINQEKNSLKLEKTGAIFIILLASFFILSNFTVGFIFPLFIFFFGLSAVIAFSHPRSGIYAIVFLTFIFERFFTLQPIIIGRSEYKLYPLDILFLAVILGIIFQKIQGKIKFNFKKIDFLLIGFILLSAVYFVAVIFIGKSDFALSFSSFKNYAFYPLFYFAIIFLINKKEHLENFLRFAFAGAVGIIFFIIFGIVSGEGLWSQFTPLSTEGVRTLAFTHAFYLSIVLMGAISYFIFNKQAFSKIYYAVLILWIVGIMGSMMRHLWIGLAVAIVLMYFIIPKDIKNNFRKLTISIIASALIFFVGLVYLASIFPNTEISDASNSVSKVISSRFVSVFSASNDESFAWRTVAWKEALKEYSKNPVLGIGFGKKVFVEIGKYRDLVEVRNIHNSLLVILVQMGILPVILLLLFIYKNAKSLWKKASKDWLDYALLGIACFYLVVILFQPYLETNLLGIFFWMILGLIRVKTYRK